MVSNAGRLASRGGVVRWLGSIFPLINGTQYTANSASFTASIVGVRWSDATPNPEPLDSQLLCLIDVLRIAIGLKVRIEIRHYLCGGTFKRHT